MSDLTSTQVRADLAARCAYPRTQQAVARELGVSLSCLNKMLRGCEPAGTMLAALGLERVMLYRRVGRGDVVMERNQRGGP